MAHDMNNILCVIKMAADDLNGESVLPLICQESVDDILSMVDRATSLTRQFQIISGRGIFNACDLDINESIVTNAVMLQRIAGECVEFKFNRASQPMVVRGDPDMIDQLVLNLVVNAREAMPDGGKLVIETASTHCDEFAVSQLDAALVGSFVSLSVTDNGRGILPALLAKVFEPFFTTKGSSKNPGLGLATVFGIVRQHQGWVSVDSEVDHGTTIRIHIPRLCSAVGSVEHSWAT